MVKKRKTFHKKFIRLLKYVGIIGYSKETNILGFNPLLISTAFIILTEILAEIGRKVVKYLYGKCEHFTKHLLLELIATLELCAVCFELIIVADNWGVEAYAIYLFVLTVWWSKVWENATACPYNPMEEVMEGTRDTKEAMMVIAVQVIGAFLTFNYVESLWALEITETHIGKAYEDCVADLQVDMLIGAAIEAAATCLCRLMSRLLAETDAKFATELDAFFSTLLVVAAFNYSGGYFNPALATSLKFGCEGNTFIEHMVVYWVGSCVGSLASVFIYKSKPVQNYLEKIRKQKEIEKEKEDKEE